MEKEREDFSRELSATEDWLYEEGEDQPKKVSRSLHCYLDLQPALLERCPHFRGCYVHVSIESGPEDVSLLEWCPHFRGSEDVSLLERCPHFRGSEGVSLLERCPHYLRLKSQIHELQYSSAP